MGKVFFVWLSFAVSLFIGLITVWTLEALPLKYVFAFTFSFLIFALLNLYTKHEESFSLKLLQGNIKTKIFFLIWLFAILFFIFVNPSDSTQFLAWNQIPILLWFKLIASFLLTTIYPGYAITQLIFKGKTSRSLLEQVIFSILLSIFISSAIAFIGTLIEGRIGYASLTLIVSVNVILLTLTSTLKRKNLFSKIGIQAFTPVKLKISTSMFLLFVLIIFILLSIYSVNFPKTLVPTIDQWLHYGNVLKALEGNLFSFIPPYYWLYMFEGVFMLGSSTPFINAYMFLFVLIPLPILCFYLMCSRFLHRNNSRVLATIIYTLFSGFGGIYTYYLTLNGSGEILPNIILASNKTFDIAAGATSFAFYLFPKTIGFSVFFMLIYLNYSKGMTRLAKSVAVSLLFALGFLSHVAEIYIFLIILLCLFLFFKKDCIDAKSTSFGIILGLIIIATVDLFAPQTKYFWNSPFSITNIALIGIVLVLSLLAFVDLNLSAIGEKLVKFCRKLALPITIFNIYALTLFVIIWLFVLPSFNVGLTGGTFVWYFYPVRLGIALFMAVIGAYLLFKIGQFKIIKFSLTILLISIGLERLFTYFSVQNTTQIATFPPVRMVELAWVGVAFLATPVIARILKYIATNDKNRRFWIPKKFLTIVLFIIIFVVGTSSTVYNIQVRSMPSVTLTDGELEALDFLRNGTPSNVTLLALGYSVNKINDFSGRYSVLNFQPAIFGATNFESFVDILRHNTYELYGNSPVKYFWLSIYDADELEEYENGYFVSQLLPSLSEAYKNDEVTIYEIPSYSSSGQTSDMGRAVLYGQSTLTGNVTIATNSFFIPELDPKTLQSIGWKEEDSENNWSVQTSQPESGNISVMPETPLTVSFNASTKGVWQYLRLSVPNVDISQYWYLILKERIETTSYNLGFLRVAIGGYTYTVRDWTAETKPPGHSSKIYVFDLNAAVPDKKEAPEKPEGSITQIYWTGYSTGDNGGTAKLNVESLAITNSTISPIDTEEMTASIETSQDSLVNVDNVPSNQKNFSEIQLLDVQLTGGFNLTIQGTNAILSPPGFEQYSKVIFSNGFEITSLANRDSIVSFTTRIGENTTLITITGGKIHLNLTSSKNATAIYVSNAEFSANGHAMFDRAFISWPYSIYNPNLPMDVDGLTKFKVNLMDQDFSLISELEVEGKYNVLTQQKATWNEWDIPWQSVLVSPYHIFLVLAIAISIVVYVVRRKGLFKIRVKSFLKNKGSVQ